MEFDTIAAIATPIGEGGLAVIRISGHEAIAIADRSFRPAGSRGPRLASAASHSIHFGHITHNGQNIDEVLVAVMRAPRTFTREDVVEISCHGGILPAKMVLDTLLGHGARLAEPGEFTKRAFLNGRIDLTQAEAVIDVIQSKTDLALRAANEQLAGKLAQRINSLRDEMVRTLAHVEAHIDFPDEDIAPDTRDKLLQGLDNAAAGMTALLATANEGQVLRRGIRAAIVGEPNAGKSSLLNQLLGRDRAIVSPVPGTTRDTIEETANIRGLPVVFIDTAGIREARDAIEAEGIRRSHDTLQNAELILHVIDASECDQRMRDDSWSALLESKKSIHVLNKVDLVLGPPPAHPGKAAPFMTVPVSCKTGKGIDKLKDVIRDKVWSGNVDGGMMEVAINLRHQNALLRAREATVRCADALRSGQPLELPAMDLRIAVNAIGEVVGKTTTEDILDAIFSQFCIGK